MSLTQNAPIAKPDLSGAARPEPSARARRVRFGLRQMLNTLGYALARKDRDVFDCPALPRPTDEMVEKAASTFANTFEVSPGCRLSRDEIAAKVKDYFWHYPFQFGDVFVDADGPHFRGLRGRHYQRYFHMFPPLLSLTGGSLAGKTVLDVACNAGFWTIQSRRAGAERVVGLDLGPKNVEQARFIQDVIGLDGVEYRQMNAYEVSREALGEFDVTLFLGLLYHFDKPIEALERLFEVTRSVAVIDTTLARTDVPAGVPMLKLQEDLVHDQNGSNRVAFVPSKSAVPLMLKHVGFREVFWIPNASRDLPLDYMTGARMTFIAMK